MRTLACHDCDLLICPSEEKGVTSLCPRCGAVLQRYKEDSIDRPLAFTFSGLFLFFIALTFPFLAMKSGGFVQETTLLTGIVNLWEQHLYGLATLVLFTCVVIPLFQLFGFLYVLIPVRFNWRAPGAILVFRTIRRLSAWAMMEVFLVGVLVALVKLAKMATIIPGAAVMAFGLLIFAMAATLSSLDPPLLWERLDHRE